VLNVIFLSAQIQTTKLKAKLPIRYLNYQIVTVITAGHQIVDYQLIQAIFTLYLQEAIADLTNYTAL